MRERRVLYTTCFLRAVATQMVGVQLGVYLPAAGLSPSQAGTVLSAGLAGAAVAALLATLLADARGRRRLLTEVALLGAVGASGAAFGSGPFWLLAAAFLGMLNAMGRDRGAALIVEQAILPATAPETERTRTFAVYNVCQDAGHGLGALLAGFPALLDRTFEIPQVQGYRAGLLLYALLLLATALLYLRLAHDPAPRPPSLSPGSRRIVTGISALFAIDAIGGGFVTSAYLSWFFHARFGADVGTIALLFAGARVFNAVSHLGAAWLARRIGLVNTMVFTHIPAGLLLVTVAYAPSFEVAAVLFLLREGLVEMDVPTRQSYVMAVVAPGERVAASGITNIVRMGGWAAGPVVAGLLAPGVALLVGAFLKISYDVLLYFAFRSVRPPEEAR
ncbi:MAG TPA: MFS transporter [Planctomycetota bacterium]|nr:MFS transporter [Planctomycetota bacterium]